MTSLPLRGLRVLDFSRVLAGPWCTMLLGDSGASVIKLERPGLGDDTRSWGPPYVGEGGKQLSTYFLSVNRSKKSIAIDIKSEAGLHICKRLATEWADVLVENFKVGTMEKLGLDYQSLVNENPGIIYCSITGFGPDGPLAKSPGYDVIVSGMYGLMSITGNEDPVKVGVASTDILTGTLAQSGILAALYERQQTGYGKKVDVSLMETQLAGLVNIASSALNSPEGSPPPRRWGTAHESIVPYQAFQCKREENIDDVPYILVGAGNDMQFSKLCCVLGIPEMASDSRFSTNSSRVKNRNLILPLLDNIFQQKTRKEWLALLDGKGFPLGPLRSVPEAFSCEQAIHRGMVEKINNPHVGMVRLPRTPISYTDSLSKSNTSVQAGNQEEKILKLPPPMLGEHTEEVLENILQFTPNEISHMEATGIIECWKNRSTQM